MTDKHIQAEAPHSNMEKDPSDWVTGDEPMTGAQKSYLKTLSEEAGAEFDETLTKAEASEQIEALQKATGRGAGHGTRHSESEAAGDEVEAAPKAKTASKGSAPKSHTSVSGADADAEPEAEEGDLFESEGSSRGR